MNKQVDLIDREKAIEEVWAIELAGLDNKKVVDMLKDLPSATPQKPQTFKWCKGCKEYDQEKHCCHRWSKVIRNTVEEMKQEYIERDVLDKIRAEIEKLRPNLRPEQMTDYDYAMVDVVNDIVAIIDKYKAENNS